MHSAARGSSRYAYLFVSLNLFLLLLFLVSSSLNLREVDSSRDRYERLVRDWFALRLLLSEQSLPRTWPDAFEQFADDVTGLVSSELIEAGSRLSEPMAISGQRLREAWNGLRPMLDRVVFSPGVPPPAMTAQLDYQMEVFHGALLGLEVVLDEFVDLQQRALQILLYFLGATLLATIGIFFLVEAESSRERQAADRVQSLAQTTIGAQEQERARISHALHDALAQELSVALLEVGELADSETPLVVERIRRRLRGAVDWVRNLAHELHPAEIDQVGLASALSAYCSELTSTSAASLEWAISDEVCDVPRHIAINVYRIAQEALTNAMRHSSAGRIVMRLSLDAEGLLLTVTDDGIGFRGGAARASSESRGIGIVGMNERANMLDSSLDIESEPGGGTRVRLAVPVVALGCTEVE